MTTITYSTTNIVSAEQLSLLFEHAGMKRPIHDLPRLQKMLDNADITVSAWDGDRLVGIARAITDYAYCCYLSDLAVDDDYQKNGIGSKLVDEVRQVIGEQCSLILISAPGAMDYYPKIGFTLSDKAYVIPRVK
ncbi:acetyltransferase (GNAT) family protein [Paenibacillus cellulosilyticus]|uniref:Acetyltransferase (GNAT) family protein n=1 Tax=Paenibacillus cellulosilyticus TaxID=375489 RepID=A0A2V2YZ20_9BACL|nr:GNAT family N-acetyltransferase [Paenibacillus cellulosilyticus]PWW07379.1 acetyltransferase (GNAT) family protein [Paenibacillus cellulosilyticus]QKS44452.1 GNAT family N-acetyltransferase [Paenibacillus cellulosilyticus]